MNSPCIEIKETPLNIVWSLRHKVMYPLEALAIVKLEDDKNGKHLGLYVDDVLVSVVSLFVDDNELQFRKLATLPEHQGKGYASKLLLHIFSFAHEQKYNRVWCNARDTAIGLYLKYGMIKTKKIFYKNKFNYTIMENKNLLK